MYAVLDQLNPPYNIEMYIDVLRLCGLRKAVVIKKTGNSCRLLCVCVCVCGVVDTGTAKNGFPYKISFINTCTESGHKTLLLNYS